MAIIYCCPALNGCTWEGRKSKIWSHFKECHANILVEDNTFKLDITREHSINLLMNVKDELYLIQAEIDNNCAKVRLRYAGDQHQASLQRFSLSVSEMESSSLNAVQNGQVQIDVGKLKLKFDYIVCKIIFETCIDISNQVNDECVLTSNEEINYDRPETEVKTKNKKTKYLQRNQSDGLYVQKKASHLRRTRSSPENHGINIFSKNGSLRRSQKKYFQSLFYTQEIDKDPEDIQELIDVADNRIHMLKNYKCFKCDYYITGPIYTCGSDHSLCFSCMNEIQQCPCNAEVSFDQRNDVLEKTRDLTQLPCRFEGCNVSVLGNQLDEHQVQCNHCVYSCPECNQFTGKYSDIEKHFRIAHPSIRRFTSLVNPMPINSTFLVLHALGVFFCKSQNHGVSVEWSVTHCGHVKIYFESNIILKTSKVTTSKSFNLPKDENRGNVLKRCVSVADVKLVKPKSCVLEIIVYKPYMIM